MAQFTVGGTALEIKAAKNEDYEIFIEHISGSKVKFKAHATSDAGLTDYDFSLDVGEKFKVSGHRAKLRITAISDGSTDINVGGQV